MKSTRALCAPRSNVRIELFFSSASDLRERIQFLRSKGVTSFNLVNKSNGDDILQWSKTIQDEFSNCGVENQDLSICAHFSLKYNKSRKSDGAFLKWENFVQNDVLRNGKHEILLISGSGPKQKFNAVTALERIPSQCIHPSMKLAVAFNPFFTSISEEEEEKTRLIQKIATGKVSKIYIQFGTDLERLRASLQMLQEMKSSNEKLEGVCGSIFLPTKKLIAQQRFRPWNGVFLSDEFLESESSAKNIVLQMIELYKEHGCEILIEAPGVRNEKDWGVVESLLSESEDDGSSKSNSNGADTTRRKEVKRRKTDENKTTNTASSESGSILSGSSVTSTSLKKPGIVLFHSHDVRVQDNLALQLACRHESIVPVFLWSSQWGVAGCLEVVLKDALSSLDSKLQNFGLKLIYREGNNPSEMLKQICAECSASAVYYNREHTTESCLREQGYRETLESMSLDYVECQSSLLYEPMSLSLSSGFHGGHWGTLMPFLKGCKKQQGEPRKPVPQHETFAMLKRTKQLQVPLRSKHLDELSLAVINGDQRWDEPILARFPMSEDNAFNSMNEFFRNGFGKYEKERSRADIDTATSNLSVHLRIGTLSPNELYWKVEESNLDYNERKTFSRRLFWRDLAYFQLLTFPQMGQKPIRVHYEDTEWCSKEEETRRFTAWKKGQTGYPLVDAGMRELYKTGWMTQSVRMVVASFLVEYLRVNWTKGYKWFDYTLVDADKAINAMMWQNAGRSGIDQWNFVMSPVAASQDASGDYTKKWVPELAGLPKASLHKPWEAPEIVLKEAGVEIGKTYPRRIILDLNSERKKSVESVLKMRRQHQNYNDDRGYDQIVLPSGKATTVFTKKEFRIDRQGNVIKEATTTKSKQSKCVARGRPKQKKIYEFMNKKNSQKEDSN